MNLARLALTSIKGNGFRSAVVAVCALLVASFSLTTTLIIQGADQSLRLAMDRLGADIVVVPQGAQARVESALLMGSPASVWMPSDNLAKLQEVPGVQAASPQLYLSTLHGAACCSVADMFLVAYDPATDFTIQPWLKQQLGTGLGLGEVVGGQHVYVPAGEQNIKVYGYFVTLKANLEPTGTGLDQTMFLTFDTAKDIARISRKQAEQPLEIPPDKISAVLVKVQQGSKANDVALSIMQQVPNVTPIISPDLFQSYHKQMASLQSSITLVLGISWVLSVVLIGLVFSMAANERRRELGVLQALGATRRYVLGSLLAEAALLATGGGLVGAALASLVVYLFRQLIVTSLGVPFLLPSPVALLGLVAAGLALALLSVSFAALVPAYRVSRLDPAAAMRE